MSICCRFAEGSSPVSDGHRSVPQPDSINPPATNTPKLRDETIMKQTPRLMLSRGTPLVPTTASLTSQRAE